MNRKVSDLSDQPKEDQTMRPAIDLDTAQLDKLIGAKGQANGGVYQFNVPRTDPVKENDMVMAPVGPRVWRLPSVFSRPAAARPRSPEISY
jgi:hypothetical protein